MWAPAAAAAFCPTNKPPCAFNLFMTSKRNPEYTFDDRVFQRSLLGNLHGPICGHVQLVRMRTIEKWPYFSRPGFSLQRDWLIPFGVSHVNNNGHELTSSANFIIQIMRIFQSVKHPYVREFISVINRQVLYACILSTFRLYGVHAWSDSREWSDLKRGQVNDARGYE